VRVECAWSAPGVQRVSVALLVGLRLCIVAHVGSGQSNHLRARRHCGPCPLVAKRFYLSSKSERIFAIKGRRFFFSALRRGAGALVFESYFPLHAVISSMTGSRSFPF
jgi:hypothetical protein